MAIEVKVNFTLDEAVIIMGLVVGHRMRMVEAADPKHWEVLQALHDKIIKSVSESIPSKEKLDEGISRNS